jgi:hypothetical protein
MTNSRPNQRDGGAAFNAPLAVTGSRQPLRDTALPTRHDCGRQLRKTAAVPIGGAHVTGDVSSAAWIAPQLGGGFGAVSRTVPRCYPAYARICHPASDPGGRPVSWTEVAAITGRQAHRLMQWHALVGSRDALSLTGSLWRGSHPQRGNLDQDVLVALCGLLGDYTTAAAECFFCIWEGYGWIQAEPKRVRFFSDENARADELSRAPAFSAEELRQPCVELPHRRYHLLTGPLPAAARLVWPPFRQSPNLFWPADRAWCTATDLDFDSTLVGGGKKLINEILEAPGLDAWPVEPHDSLAADADQINAPA